MTGRLFSESLVLRFRGEVTGNDEYGNDVVGPPRDEVWPGWFEPRSSGEDTNAREQYVYGYWVYLPFEAPVRGADSVVIFGDEFRVVGEPGRQPGGFVVDGFTRVAVERVTG